jgi:MFS transporter, DHA1 family, multidrug resistance protein
MEGQLDRGAVDWRRNLVVLWIATAASILGLTLTFPFMALFINRDLDVRDAHQLAFWTGLATAATGVGLACGSLAWAVAANRFGNKPMLVRSLVSGGLALMAMGLVQSPLQLTAARLLYGAFAGPLPVTIALASKEAPRHRIGWSLGAVFSAVAVGSAIGPLFGGLALSVMSLRWIYAAGGLLVLLSTLPVILLVRESPTRRAQGRTGGLLAELRVSTGLLAAIIALLAAQFLVQMIGGSAQPLFALRLLHLAPNRAAFYTGLAFATAGATTAVGAASYAVIADRIGYRVTMLAAASCAAVITAIAGVTNEIVLVVTCVGLFGLVQGCLSPAVSSMIGMEAPSRVQTTVFGFMSVALALGFTVGPLVAGIIAAFRDASAALLFTSGSAIVLTTLLMARVREPPSEHVLASELGSAPHS